MESLKNNSLNESSVIVVTIGQKEETYFIRSDSYSKATQMALDIYGKTIRPEIINAKVVLDVNEYYENKED